MSAPLLSVPVPFLSVIVPCRNEADSLGACLDSILNSGYPKERLEILVADGLSDDGTRELAESYAAEHRQVRLVDNPHRITPAALNRALACARGEIIARLDAHATVLPGYFSHAVRCLEASGAANVGGRMHTMTRDCGPFAEPIRIALTSRFGVGNSRFRTGAGVASIYTGASEQTCLADTVAVDTVFGGCWPREVFSRIGGFNERLERSQDLEFNLRLRRAGGKILLNPAMESRYFARATLKYFLRHNWENGVWAVLPFAYARGVPVRWRHLAPLGFVLLAGVSLALARWIPWLPVAVLAPYLAVTMLASAMAAWKARRPGLLVLQPIAFWSLHIPYGLGSVIGTLRTLRVLGALRSRGNT